MCNDKTIKELLPAYREQALDQTKNLIIENHLASCEDCRIELSHLRMMAEEAVPDPGEAFWAAMPGRVYQTVQQQKAERKTFNLAGILDRLSLPRWSWAAASVMSVLVLSWFIVRPVQHRPVMAPSQKLEFVDENFPSDPVNINELDNKQLSTIESWAGVELAAIARETEHLLGNSQDSEVEEDIVELNAQQADKLMNMIDQRMKEDYT